MERRQKERIDRIEECWMDDPLYEERAVIVAVVAMDRWEVDCAFPPSPRVEPCVRICLVVVGCVVGCVRWNEIRLGSVKETH